MEKRKMKNHLSKDIEDKVLAVLAGCADSDYPKGDELVCPTCRETFSAKAKAINQLIFDYIKDLVGEAEPLDGAEELARNSLRYELLELAEKNLADLRGSDDN